MYILNDKTMNDAFIRPYFWVCYLAVIAYPFPRFWMNWFVAAVNAAA